jgi:two-component system response regulator YesN
MWKALIADDEAFSRYALRTFLAKNSEHIEVVAEAADGDEAVSLARELKPELVFMDIKMPGRNGIDASAAILEDAPHTKIMMLSAYDHFSYVQKALEIGVRGYLLKPFQQEELSRQLDILQQELAGEASAGGDEERESLRRYAASELLDLLLFPSADTDREAALLQFPEGLRISSGVLFLADGLTVPERTRYWLCSSLCTGLRENANILTGRGYGASLIALLPPDEAERYASRLEDLKKSRPELAGISSVFAAAANRDAIPDAFRRALTVLEGVKKSGRTITLDTENPAGSEAAIRYPWEREESFLVALEEGRFDDAQRFKEDLLTELEESGTHSPELLDHLGGLMVLIRRRAGRAAFRLESDPGTMPLRSLLSFRDTGTALKMLDELIADCRRSSADRTETLPAWKLSRAFLYIRQHLYGELGLEQVADEVGLSPQYLSKRFREEYGKTFTEYVTTERIHRAKFLLGTTTRSIKSICTGAGYPDANYFSRVFKKETGLTPQQYRDQIAASSAGSSS